MLSKPMSKFAEYKNAYKAIKADELRKEGCGEVEVKKRRRRNRKRKSVRRSLSVFVSVLYGLNQQKVQPNMGIIGKNLYFEKPLRKKTVAHRLNFNP
jgi:hypothetical protein